MFRQNQNFTNGLDAKAQNIYWVQSTKIAAILKTVCQSLLVWDKKL